MKFFKKFFTQSNDEEHLIGLLGKGEGAFGYRHFIWIALTIVLAIVLYKLFKKHPKAGKWFVLISSVLLFTVRLINQIYRAIKGLENPWYAAFPFHLCTLMTFIIPVVAFFNLKELKKYVYGTAIMGGVITVLFGEYFDYKFLTFGTLEGITAHMLLIYIPLVEIAIDNFHFDIKDWWKTTIAMATCCLWATLGNLVIFKDYNKNFMYLRRNALPFDTKVPFFLIYVLIYVVFLLIMQGVPTLYRNKKNKEKTN